VSRPTHRTDAENADFDFLTDGDAEIELFADSAGGGKNARPSRKGIKPKAAWQRVDERKDAKLLRAQLEDWEDWDPRWPDGSVWEPGPD
jgi:hypothetical protein